MKIIAFLFAECKNTLYIYIIIITQKLTTMKTLKFKNTAKGQKAKAIAKSLGNILEIAIIEELRLRGYSKHFISEIYA